MKSDNQWDTRVSDLNSLNFNDCNLNSVEILNPWSDSNDVESRYFSAREFTVSNDVVKFAYKLASWKLPYIQDKEGMPKRTEEERLYHTFMGCVTECLTYLYLNSLGVENISYYDVERKSPVYNRNEEYDLKINGNGMSLKVIPALYQEYSDGLHFDSRDLIIKRTAGSDDRYFTQFIIPTEQKLNYHSTMEKFIDNIRNGEPLFLKFWMLGGIVNNNQSGVFWLSRDNTKNQYLKFEKKYDVSNYIQGIMSDIKG